MMDSGTSILERLFDFMENEARLCSIEELRFMIHD